MSTTMSNITCTDVEGELAIAAPAPPEQSATELICKLVKKIESISTELLELRKFARVTERAVAKIEREAIKVGRRKTKRAGPSSAVPSGFRLPVKILPKLTMFLNDMRAERGEPAQGAGEMIARTEVTRFLTSYVKTHALQDPDEPRLIALNTTLASLFDLTEGDRITWFNMQTYLKPLYDQSEEAKLDNTRAKIAIAADRAAASKVTDLTNVVVADTAPDEAAPPKAKRTKRPAATASSALEVGVEAAPAAPVGETPIAKAKKTAAAKKNVTI